MARPRSSLGKQLRHAWNAFVSDREDASIAANNNFSRYYGRSSTNAGNTNSAHQK